MLGPGHVLSGHLHLYEASWRNYSVLAKVMQLPTQFDAGPTTHVQERSMVNSASTVPRKFPVAWKLKCSRRARAANAGLLS